MMKRERGFSPRPQWREAGHSPDELFICHCEGFSPEAISEIATVACGDLAMTGGSHFARMGQWRRKRMKKEKGFTLLEVMVAIVLLGIVAVAIYGGLVTASKSMSTADERTMAESLARTEMEYVRKQVYSVAPWDYVLPSGNGTNKPSWWSTANHTLPAGYAGYTVSVNATALSSQGTDNGIQKITVMVKHEDKPGVFNNVFTLVDYRSQR